MSLAPLTAASDLDEAWYERVQEAIALRRPRMRAGAEQPTIQIWSDGRGQWQNLMLPSGGVLFDSFESRNLVWRRLMGK